MTDQLDQPLDRRFLLRGGAVLAGAAGATVLGAAIASPKAEAAPVDYVRLGTTNSPTATTTITIDDPAGGPDAPLLLANANGPQLNLQALPIGWGGTLATGDIVNTLEGPRIGVNYGDGVENDYLVTGRMLESIPYVVPIPYGRVIDTREDSQRSAIIATSSGALDDQHRLKKGAWMDVALFPTSPDYTIFAVFVNLTVAKPSKNGYLTAYAPSQPKPSASTLNFSTGQNLSNAAFVSVSVVDDAHAVRIYASKTTHVVLDLSGLEVSSIGSVGPDAQRVPKAIQVRQQKQAQLMAHLNKVIGSR